jgi:hypothetical protein
VVIAKAGAAGPSIDDNKTDATSAGNFMAFSRRGNQTRIRPGFRTIVADSRWATHQGTPAARTDGRVSVVWHPIG